MRTNTENWTTDTIDDLSGKTAIVTGANSGIGKEAAKAMATKGVEVILAVRNVEKGTKAAEEIRQVYPEATLRVEKLDLASLQSVKEFSQKIVDSYSQLHYLVNNAGVMVPPYAKTEDGFELQFGTNHLGHFALTGLLLPLLKATPNARIVTVSSSAHGIGNIDFDDLNWEKRKYKASAAYGDSKIANLYFTYELAEKLRDTDIMVTAAHPGWTATDLQRHSKVFGFLNPFLAQTPSMGALPTLRGALDPDAESGDYFGPKGLGGARGYPVKVDSNTRSHDRGIAKTLWAVSEELTGITY